ncbi:glycosyltransferase [Vibrio breoganii]|uniref:glycosyltransferase n=1 Tax=Vibrio breoganii TaxID=553239 RepID=UPI000C8253D2|nr:glycosyltransferase [Vibrio breoganii]PMM19870.1 hypothetical protein BCT59_08765 [Vibrio breoganii]
MKKSTVKVAQIIHHLQIGGVENAALYHLNNSKLEFKVFCLSYADPKLINSKNRSNIIFRNTGESKLKYIFRLVNELRSYNPNVMLSSLWASHIVSLILHNTIFLRKNRWIPFFHSANFFHNKDRFFSLISIYFSTNILCDSKETTLFLKNYIKNRHYQVINFNFFYEVAESIDFYERESKFVYFGRLSPVKNLFYMVDVFYELTLLKDLSLNIYGDGEQMNELKSYIKDRGLSEVVFLKGEILPHSVPVIMNQNKFLIQTSIVEGMAMSVNQAMSSGMCVFTTSVGEIANYGIDGVNLFTLDLDCPKKAAKKIYNALNNIDFCFNVAKEAEKTFKIDNSITYSDSLDSFCLSLFH